MLSYSLVSARLSKCPVKSKTAPPTILHTAYPTSVFFIALITSRHTFIVCLPHLNMNSMLFLEVAKPPQQYLNICSMTKLKKNDYYSGRQKLEVGEALEKSKILQMKKTPAKILHEGWEVQGMFRMSLARIWGKCAAAVGDKTRNRAGSWSERLWLPDQVVSNSTN